MLTQKIVTVSRKGEDSYSTSLEKTKKEITYIPWDSIHGKERSIFAADVSELQVVDMKRCTKEGQERAKVELDDVHGSSSVSDKGRTQIQIQLQDLIQRMLKWRGRNKWL